MNTVSRCIFSRFYHRNSRQVIVKDVYKFWKDKFQKNNIPEPTESIQHILAYNLGSKKITDVHMNINKILKDFEIDNIKKMCELRLKRMPVQYIIKEWDFRDMTLRMKPPVFIPRPETEMIIDIILSDCEPEKSYNILEIGCGSGAISLALLNLLKNETQKDLKRLQEILKILKTRYEDCKYIVATLDDIRTSSRAVAIDRSGTACDLTKENSKIHKLNDRIKVVETTIDENNKLNEYKDFDIIVSNPPYVPRKDLKEIQPEIGFYEDLNALDGGEDGLDLIKVILELSVEKLVGGGMLYMETDRTHPELIKNMVDSRYEKYLKYIEKYKDFFNDRFVKIERLAKMT